MNRRRFLLAVPISIAALGARFARAQLTRKPLRIGFIASGGTNADMQGPEPRFASARAFLVGLRELGYRDGVDFTIEGRGGGGRPDRYSTLARELVAANVDVIVAGGPTVDAVRRATSRIPIVMVGGAFDPVHEKVVTTLSSPGGNVTGLTLQQVDLVGKRLELLKEVVPGAAPVGVLWEETSVGAWKASEAAGVTRRLRLLARQVRDAAGIAPACAALHAEGATSLLVVSGGVLFENAAIVVDAARARRLPAIYSLRVFAERGGLMSYAADLEDLFRRAAAFVDRIAKGAHPATMPIEQPTQFELVVNLSAARAIGVTLPPAIVARAAQVIQ